MQARAAMRTTQRALMSDYERWSPDRAAEIIAPHRTRPGALLPMLHALQETFGHVPDAAVPIVAETLNLSRADVHGVLTFYHDFRRELAGRRVLKLCQAEACQARGARAVTARREGAGRAAG
jgi:formate dehydrogenase subunit gamma